MDLQSFLAPTRASNGQNLDQQKLQDGMAVQAAKRYYFIPSKTEVIETPFKIEVIEIPFKIEVIEIPFKFPIEEIKAAKNRLLHLVTEYSGNPSLPCKTLILAGTRRAD